MTTHHSAFSIQITPAKPNDMGRLAEADVVFEDGACHGCRLTGFTVWRRKRGEGVNVTFPGRTYTNTSGERRQFSFIQGDRESVARCRALILEAYQAYEASHPPTDGA